MKPTHRLVRVRRQQRGAALFVVVLAIVLITAIGIFSARAAGLVDVASGYNRQSVQTQFMADYGARSTAAELGTGTGGTYVRSMTGVAGNPVPTCRANADLDTLLPPGTVIPCWKLRMTQVQETFGVNAVEATTPTAAGSLGPPDDAENQLVANYEVEMTEPGLAGAPLAGFNAGGTDHTFRPTQIALTSRGVIRPWTNPGDANCNIESTRSAGVSFLRAHVTTVVPQ